MRDAIACCPHKHPIFTKHSRATILTALTYRLNCSGKSHADSVCNCLIFKPSRGHMLAYHSEVFACVVDELFVGSTHSWIDSWLIRLRTCAGTFPAGVTSTE